MRQIKWTREFLEQLVPSATSIFDVLRKAGSVPSAGMCSYIGSKIRGYGIDMTHFSGAAAASRSNGKQSKIDYRKVLSNNRLGHKEESSRLRRAMIESGVEYVCSICALPPQWFGQDLTLEIDHISGDNLDNRRENLRFLCPNCHAQTPTHDSKNVKLRYRAMPKPCAGRSATKPRGAWSQKPCSTCGTMTGNDEFCSKSCAGRTAKRRHVERPTLEQLQVDLAVLPYTQVGEKYGVSDNAVRKWLKAYGQTPPPRPCGPKPKPKTRACVAES
jgi:5-methylcytosine-specific restriction endonuclease McrA